MPGSRRLPVLGIATVLALAALQAPGAAESPPTGQEPDAVQQPDGAPTEHRITLVTGDVVSLTEWPDGRRGAMLVPDESGGAIRHNAFVRETDEGLFVIPEQAQDLLDSGVLDVGLFNVTSLLAQGYDDARSAELPLIVAYDDATPAARAQAPAGATRTRTLTSVNANALRTPKKQAGRLWKDLVRPGAGNRRARLDGGVEHVWLDARMRADLDRSTAQIGAPAAWQAGYDGKGVKVAVLDSGIDLTHPDLAGKVVDSRNFTTEASVTDLNGHGTHVASTIAGSGAASDGRYRGVAPGAGLIVGKVLDRTGQGTTSAVMAAMEWAARDGADVISMSLGSGPSNGDDPASLAVNALTEETGALFVIAAGNTGPTPASVSSPSTAAAALSVAAVDRNDATASFSSRGPTPNGTLKPDISAPGVGIVAARAAGTSPGTTVNDYYAALSGTSMATPHVSGAAAILAQEHPDFSPRQLKDALMSTSKQIAAASGFDQGAGRTDLARATSQALTATGSVSYGFFKYGVATDPVQRTVGYRNDGDTPLTLDLTVRGATSLGEALPAGVVTPSQDSVTVPAHGTAEVTLTADTGQGPSGRITGELTAVAREDAATAVHTEFGLVKEDQVVQVTVKGINHAGKPAYRNSDASLYNLETGATSTVPLNSLGQAVFRVKPGTYSLMGYLASHDESGTQVVDFTLAGDPEVTVSGDMTLTLDGSKAREIAVRTPKPAEHRGVILGYERTSGSRMLSQIAQLDQYVDHIYALPTDRTDRERFTVFSQWVMTSPELTVTTAGGQPVPTPEYVVGSPKLDGTSVLRAVPAGTATGAELAGRDLAGGLALIRADAAVPLTEQVANAAKAGASAALVYATAPGRFLASGTTAIPAMTLDAGPGAALAEQAAGGDLKLKVVADARSRYAYDLLFPWNQQIPEDTSVTVDDTTTARIEADYHSPLAGGTGRDLRWAFRPGAIQATVWTTPRPLPSPIHRTEWVSTAGVEWEHFAYLNGEYDSVVKGDRTGYRPGQVVEESWHKGVLRPAIPEGRGEFYPLRGATQLNLGVQPWTDGSNVHEGVYGFKTDKSTTQLFAHGQLIVKRTTAVGSFPAPYAEPTEYTLTMDTERTASWWPLSTRTHSEWTFTSARPTSGTAPVPLLQLYYDLPLDLQNRAPSGAPYTFQVHTAEPGVTDAAAVGALTAEVSYDDGATWQRSEAAGLGGGRFSVTARHPAGPGYVSLRFAASDADGNSVTQTVIRAYALR
ncbi:S8 family peptidase [Streptomyces sp. NPDC051940]|uniref:S8 family peptidase n=1 Tax=Streptomyces sp. NPDC051940 TaxID=3155675 RepID=UPI00342DAE16